MQAVDVLRLVLNAERLAVAGDLPRPEPPASAVFYGMTDDERQVLGRFFRGERLVEIPAQRAKRSVVLERIALEFEPGVRYSEPVGLRARLICTESPHQVGDFSTSVP